METLWDGGERGRAPGRGRVVETPPGLNLAEYRTEPRLQKRPGGAPVVRGGRPAGNRGTGGVS